MPDTLLFDAEVFTAAVSIPDRPDMFIVIACGGEGIWAIPSTLRGMFIDQASAERAVAGLTSFWKHARVVRIPGEKGHLLRAAWRCSHCGGYDAGGLILHCSGCGREG